jgi:hypothetical protein
MKLFITSTVVCLLSFSAVSQPAIGWQKSSESKNPLSSEFRKSIDENELNNIRKS